MSLKAILFDLDATLLPMDQDEFLKMYFSTLTAKLVGAGCNPEIFAKALKSGIKAIKLQDGSCTNEQAFWRDFSSAFGRDVAPYIPYFNEFYEKDYSAIRSVCGYNPEAAATVRELKSLGYRVALATNPYFPATATEQRMSWAGFSPSDFELYTTYENSRFSKPGAGYYLDVASSLGLAPEECLMVGNDTVDDMSALQVGMKVFLITDHLINTPGLDISVYPRGSFKELIEYVKGGA